MNTAVAHIYYFKYLLRVYHENALYFPIQHYGLPFIMDTDRILCEVRTKYLFRIYTEVSLQRVTGVFVCVCVWLYFTMQYVNSYSSLELTETNRIAPEFSPLRNTWARRTQSVMNCATHYYWVGKPLDHRIFHTRNSHWSVVMIETSNIALSYRNMVTDIAWWYADCM